MDVKTWTLYDRGESSSLTSIFGVYGVSLLIARTACYARVLPVASLYADRNHCILLCNQILHIDMRGPNNYFGILPMREQCIIKLQRLIQLYDPKLITFAGKLMQYHTEILMQISASLKWRAFGELIITWSNLPSSCSIILLHARLT